jgi:hypothetical protein
MARKPHPKPISNDIVKFLRSALKKGRKPANEVLQAAIDRGFSKDTVNCLSKDIVDKQFNIGEDGIRKSYWTLRESTSPSPLPQSRPKSQAAILAEEAAFELGYEKAVDDMWQRFEWIYNEQGPNSTTESIFEWVCDELQNLKPDSRT